jgi:hypothetical protein
MARRTSTRLGRVCSRRREPRDYGWQETRFAARAIVLQGIELTPGASDFKCEAFGIKNLFGKGRTHSKKSGMDVSFRVDGLE